MRYHEAAEYLHELRRFRVRPGTESTADLLAALGDPQDSFTVVQVAGSNGKGSTAKMVESVLRQAGADVGLYTSPHLTDLRERAQVNGRPVTKRAVTGFVEAAADHVDDRAAAGDPPTFFEVVTAMACWTFARADVDVAVLEVGIGGRHDATSAVDPAASAVTSVTTEHTDVLGESVAEIARDLATVAPADRPLVTAAGGEALAGVRDGAGDVLTVGGAREPTGENPAPDVRATYGGVRDRVEAAVALEGPDWAVDTRVPLPGRHQARNAGVAAALARQVAPDLGVDVDEATLARGLRSAHWPGRFEVVERDPLVVLDGAHNPAACAAVADTLAEYDYDELTLVVGSMNDKDHAAMAGALPPAARVVVTRPALERAESRSVLARAYEAADRHGAVETGGAVESAVESAVADADPGDCVLVTGSLYTVAAARTRWSAAPVPKDVEDVETARAVLEGADVGQPGVWRMRAKGVHRVLKTRVRATQAQYLKEELLSLGGECAVSSAGDRYVDVVCSGTLAQFRRLVEKLDGQSDGLEVVADRLRETLDLPGHGSGSSGAGSAPVPTEPPWTDRTAVMGILNVTPDSFHDGGEYEALDAAVARAESMVAAGADVVDVGGESTNPAAEPVDAATERERVVPVLEALTERDLNALVSVDTRKASVAHAAVAAGADVINDVSGLADPAMRFVAAEHDVPLVVMHSLEAPVDPDTAVEYDDVVERVIAELAETVRRAEQAGVNRSNILVDPGLGFGKTAAESWALLGRLDELRALGCPVLVGHSHKSMFGAVDRYPDEGGYATVAATALAAGRGVDVVRVHDVPENVAAVRAASAARRPFGRDDGQPD
ncbi:MAG: dihydropteroate synthase [Halobacteriaceae archaeon]